MRRHAYPVGRHGAAVSTSHGRHPSGRALAPYLALGSSRNRTCSPPRPTDMTATSSDGTTSWSPSWPYCGHDAAPDSAGCRGRSVEPDCQFAGTVHLDELRLEGRCPLPAAPSGLRWRGVRPVRWTPRRTLAEEQHWRATRHGAADGWTSAPDRVGVLEPAALASSYRQLRKGFEDGKNEPGAADFYYGEMEMRRHDPDTPAPNEACSPRTGHCPATGCEPRAPWAGCWRP